MVAPGCVMDRRIFLTTAAAAAALPLSARAQGLSLVPIEPQNDLEEDFVAAFNTPSRRLAFRHAMVSNPLTLALDHAGDNARPLTVDVTLRTGPFRGAAVFTSHARLISALGGDAPSTTEPGRDILERLRGQNVVLNYRLIPVLTLDASDVADYLSNAPASAGPAQ